MTSKCIHQVKAEICENRSQIGHISLERNDGAKNPYSLIQVLKRVIRSRGTGRPSASRDASIDFCYVTNLTYVTGNLSFLTLFPIFFWNLCSSVADPDLNPNPDPPDPHIFGPPGSGSGSTSQRYGSGSFYHHAYIVWKTWIPSIWWPCLTFYLWKMMKM